MWILKPFFEVPFCWLPSGEVKQVSNLCNQLNGREERKNTEAERNLEFQLVV